MLIILYVFMLENPAFAQCRSLCIQIIKPKYFFPQAVSSLYTGLTLVAGRCCSQDGASFVAVYSVLEHCVECMAIIAQPSDSFLKAKVYFFFYIYVSLRAQSYAQPCKVWLCSKWHTCLLPSTQCILPTIF